MIQIEFDEKMYFSPRKHPIIVYRSNKWVMIKVFIAYVLTFSFRTNRNSVTQIPLLLAIWIDEHLAKRIVNNYSFHINRLLAIISIRIVWIIFLSSYVLWYFFSLQFATILLVKYLTFLIRLLIHSVISNSKISYFVGWWIKIIKYLRIKCGKHDLYNASLFFSWATQIWHVYTMCTV